jgi:hypothetical protein
VVFRLSAESYAIELQKEMVRLAGVEPAASAMSMRRSSGELETQEMVLAGGLESPIVWM